MPISSPIIHIVLSLVSMLAAGWSLFKRQKLKLPSFKQPPGPAEGLYINVHIDKAKIVIVGDNGAKTKGTARKIK